MAVDPNDYYQISKDSNFIQCPLNTGGDIECNPADKLNDQVWFVGSDPQNTTLQCTIQNNGSPVWMVAEAKDGGNVTSTSNQSEATQFCIHDDGGIELLPASGDDKYFLYQSGAKVKVQKTIKQTWTWNKTKLGSSGHIG